MSFGSDLATARLTVVLDIRDPRAFLALAPAIAFGRELGVAINWLPLAAEPLRPPSAPGPDDDRGVRHRRHRAQMIAREIAVYAQSQGLTLEEPYRNAPADAAHQAWLWMRAQARQGLEADRPFLRCGDTHVPLLFENRARQLVRNRRVQNCMPNPHSSTLEIVHIVDIQISQELSNFRVQAG